MLPLSLLCACPGPKENTGQSASPSPRPSATPTILVRVSAPPVESLETPISPTLTPTPTPRPVPTASPTPASQPKDQGSEKKVALEPLAPKMFVRQNPTRVYKEAKSSSEVVGELPVSSEVYITHFNEADQFPHWALVEFQQDGFPESGWIPRSQLSLRPVISLNKNGDTPNTANSANTANSSSSDKSAGGAPYYVNADQVNLRQAPSLQAPILLTAGLNTPVSLAQQEARAEGFLWKEVRLSDGRKAWVASRFLSSHKITDAVSPPHLPPSTHNTAPQPNLVSPPSLPPESRSLGEPPTAGQ